MVRVIARVELFRNDLRGSKNYFELAGGLSSSRVRFIKTAKEMGLNRGFTVLKVSVNENFSTLLDFVFFFWHQWVLNFILAEKENQKVLFNPSKMSLF